MTRALVTAGLLIGAYTICFYVCRAIERWAGTRD